MYAVHVLVFRMKTNKELTRVTRWLTSSAFLGKLISTLRLLGLECFVCSAVDSCLQQCWLSLFSRDKLALIHKPPSLCAATPWDH